MHVLQRLNALFLLRNVVWDSYSFFSLFYSHLRRRFCDVILLQIAMVWAGRFAVPVFLTFLNTRIWSGAYNQVFATVITRPLHTPVVDGISHKLHINTIVCTCHVLIQRESFIFVRICETVGALFFFPWQPQSAQFLQSPDEPSIYFLSYLKQGACSWLVFVQLW